MEKVILNRFAYTPMGTFGSLQLSNGVTIYTVEDAWRENEPNVSCIPLGTYQCSPRFYNRGGYPAIEIENVDGRSHILIHRGNTELDVEGCIVTGMKLGFIEGRWAVSNSRGAFDLFSDLYGDREFQIEIIQFDPNSDSYINANTATHSPSVSHASVQSLQRFGVIIKPDQLDDYVFVDQIKNGDDALESDEDSQTNTLENLQRELQQFGVSWFEGIGYLSQKQANRFTFFSTEILVQRGQGDEPLCSLMPLGGGGFLNVATQLSPVSKRLESLRSYIQQTTGNQGTDIQLSELAYGVSNARLLLTDRSGSTSVLSEASVSRNPPYNAMFGTRITVQDFPLVNASLEGEHGLLEVEYDVVFKFAVSQHVSLRADWSRVEPVLIRNSFWTDNLSVEEQMQLLARLIEEGDVVITFANAGHESSKSQALLDEVKQDFLNFCATQGPNNNPDSASTDSVIEDEVVIEKSQDIDVPIQITVSVDAASWNAGGVEF